MNQNMDQLNALSRKNMEFAWKLSQLSNASIQRIATLQSEFARQIFEAEVNNLRQISKTTDAQEILRLRDTHVQALAQAMLAMTQKMSAAGMDNQAEWTRLVTEQAMTGGPELADSVNEFLKGFPFVNSVVPEWLKAGSGKAA